MAKKRKTVKKKVEVNADTMGELVDSMVDSVEEDTEEVKIEEVAPNPTMNDPNWTEFVLDQLEDDELEEGFPNISGLRRISRVLLGEFTSSVSKLDKVPTKEDRSASATHTITYMKFVPDYGQLIEVTVNGIADVTEHNCPPMFFKHAASTVDTKAESKCLRRALQLKCLTAEEIKSGISDGELNLDPEGDKEKIWPQTIMAIDQVAKRNDINIEKFIKATSIWANISCIEELTRDDGKLVMANFSEIQRTGKNEYAGYDAGWRNKFSKRGK